MDDDIRSLLGLRGYRVREVSDEDGDAVVRVDPPAEDGCPRCGVITARVHTRSRRPSRILWAFLGGRRLWVIVQRRRLWCTDCARAFTARLPGVRPRGRMSVTAAIDVLAALRELSFAALHRSHGVGYGQARRALERLPVPWCDWSLLMGTEGPIALGVDEHSFRGKDLVITVTCLSSGRLVAILPDQRQVTLRGCLRSMPEELRSRVVGVASISRPAIGPCSAPSCPGHASWPTASTSSPMATAGSTRPGGSRAVLCGSRCPGGPCSRAWNG